MGERLISRDGYKPEDVVLEKKTGKVKLKLVFKG